MSCWGGISEYEKEEPDGVCPECGEPTFNGEAIGGCSYSPTTCEACGDCPCDGSC